MVPSGMFMVGCCGCGRLLAKDGTLTQKVLDGGTFDMAALRNAENTAQYFATRYECDEAALKSGWSVKGGNHRCPDCDYRDDQPIGMYVEVTR